MPFLAAACSYCVMANPCTSCPSVHVGSKDALSSMFEDSPGSRFQEEQSRSFWTGYRYKCQSDEKEYFKRYEHSTVRAFQLWAIARLILDTLLPFYHMTSGIDAVVFLLAYIPNIAIATTTLLMVSFMPRCRKHVVLIISITVALLAVSGGIIVHVHTGVWFDQAMRSDLARVAERISDDIDAKRDLQVMLSPGARQRSQGTGKPPLCRHIHTTPPPPGVVPSKGATTVYRTT